MIDLRDENEWSIAIARYMCQDRLSELLWWVQQRVAIPVVFVGAKVPLVPPKVLNIAAPAHLVSEVIEIGCHYVDFCLSFELTV